MNERNLKDEIRPISREYLETDEYPTIHVVASAGNTLDFCGIQHSNDPDNPNDRYMLDRIKNELGEFLERPSDHQKIVLLEGWKGPRTAMDELSEDNLIRAGGEEALADRMVRAADVEIMNPEPDRKEEFDQLCREFPENEVFYWFVARQAVQWGREHPVPPADQIEQRDERQQAVRQKFDQLVTTLEDTLGREPSFRETTASFDMLQQTHAELFGGELDWHDIGHFAAQANPIDEHSVINTIMNRSNRIRDEHILGKIKESMDAGKDIFALYGDGHAFTLEEALRQLGE